MAAAAATKIKVTAATTGVNPCLPAEAKDDKTLAKVGRRAEGPDVTELTIATSAPNADWAPTEIVLTTPFFPTILKSGGLQ